jgi:hypothetical protein
MSAPRSDPDSPKSPLFRSDDEPADAKTCVLDEGSEESSQIKDLLSNCSTPPKSPHFRLLAYVARTDSSAV